MAPKKISVIIPFYKGGAYAEQLAASLSRQSFIDFEIILIDDGCGLDFEVLYHSFEKFSLNDRTKFVSSIKNSGPWFARNIGIDLAEAQLICFLDCDDYWAENYLSVMYEAAVESNALFIASNLIYLSGSKSTKSHLPEKISRIQLLQTNPIQPSGVMIAVKAIQSLRFSCCGHEDLDFFLKLTSQNVSVQCLNTDQVVVVRNCNSLSANKMNASVWQWKILRTHCRSTMCASILFFIYAINGILKRLMALYRPIFLPQYLARKLILNEVH